MLALRGAGDWGRLTRRVVSTTAGTMKVEHTQVQSTLYSGVSWRASLKKDRMPFGAPLDVNPYAK